MRTAQSRHPTETRVSAVAAHIADIRCESEVSGQPNLQVADEGNFRRTIRNDHSSANEKDRSLVINHMKTQDGSVGFEL